jgi:hypothetical protein
VAIPSNKDTSEGRIFDQADHDPIHRLIEHGYTPREAAFLYLVGRFSGFFIGRQFTEFIDRERGAILNRFVSMAQAREHLEVLRCGPRAHVYHLKSRSVYRLLGCEDSQNRRLKGDAEIKTRLMILDYVLESPGRKLLSSEREKLAVLRDKLEIPEAELPATLYANTRVVGQMAVRYFADRFPIAVDCSGDASAIEFTYFDNGTCTIKPFRRYLVDYKPLLIALGTFHMVYVADSKQNFAAATDAFNKTFAQAVDASTCELLPFGVDHLLAFFSASQRWDNNSPDFSPQDLRYLKEGERLYTRAEHDELHFAWPSGRAAFVQRMKSLGLQKQIKATFESYLLARNYPIFGWRTEPKRTSRSFRPPF